MSGHTEGPWEVSCGDIWAISPWNARVRLAAVTAFSPMNGIDHSANARLIAAAPDLYEALRLAMPLLESANAKCTNDTAFIAVARAAIAKAEGQS